MRAKVQDSRTKKGYRTVQLNRRKAIAEKCLNCSGFVYAERRNCSFTECELFPFRTGVGKQDAKARNRAIRDFCRAYCMDGMHSYVWDCPSSDCPLYGYRMSYSKKGGSTNE